MTQITLGSGRKVNLVYDDHAGLRHVVLASGAKHSVSCQPSIGFVRFTYTPPGIVFKSDNKPYCSIL